MNVQNYSIVFLHHDGVCYLCLRLCYTISTAYAKKLE